MTMPIQHADTGRNSYEEGRILLVPVQDGERSLLHLERRRGELTRSSLS